MRFVDMHEDAHVAVDFVISPSGGDVLRLSKCQHVRNWPPLMQRDHRQLQKHLLQSQDSIPKTSTCSGGDDCAEKPASMLLVA